MSQTGSPQGHDREIEGRSPLRRRLRRPGTNDHDVDSPLGLGRWHSAHLRANNEPHVEGRLEREASTPPGHDVHGPAGMRPESELRAIHPELAAGNLAHLLVHTPQLEFAHLEAHGRAAVAASARLMKHDGAVRAYQLF